MVIEDEIPWDESAITGNGTDYAKVAFLSRYNNCDSVNTGGSFAVYQILDGCASSTSDSVLCASERRLPSDRGVAFEPH